MRRLFILLALLFVCSAGAQAQTFRLQDGGKLSRGQTNWQYTSPGGQVFQLSDDTRDKILEVQAVLFEEVEDFDLTSVAEQNPLPRGRPTRILAGVPPYGVQSTASIIPRNWSEFRPLSGIATITNITGSADVCNVTTSGPHNFINGDYIVVNGTGTNCDVGSTPVLSYSRSSGNPTITISTTENIKFYNGAHIFIEGAASTCAALNGAWLAGVASEPTSTFTIQSPKTTALSVTPNGCVVVYAVQVTVTSATTFTYSRPGASGSASTGTTFSARLIPPLVGGAPFIQNSLLNAPLYVLSYPANAPASGGIVISGCDALRLTKFHSTDSPWDASGTYLLLKCNTGGPLVYRVDWSGPTQFTGNPSLTLVRDINSSGSAPCKWDRNVANKLWCVNKQALNQLVYFSDAAGSGPGWQNTTVAYSFGPEGCTSISIAGPTGGQDEGPGTSIGGRLAIRCVTPSGKIDLIVFNIGTNSIEARYSSPLSATGDIDWYHIMDKPDGTLVGAIARWPQTCNDDLNGTFTITGNTGVYSKPSTCSFGFLLSGMKARLFNCSNPTHNRLWTVVSGTSGNPATVTIDATGFSGSSTGCNIGLQDRGLNYYLKSGSNLVLNNIVWWRGSHGVGGLDFDGHAVIMTAAGPNGGNLCPVFNNGSASIHTDISFWPEGTSWSNQVTTVGVCHHDYNPFGLNGDNNVGISAVGWYVGSPRDTSTSPAINIATVARTSNVVTITTSAAHGLNTSSMVRVNAVTNTSINGEFPVASAPNSTTFTYNLAGANIASGPDTGTTLELEVASQEANLLADWFSSPPSTNKWRTGEHEIYISKLVEPGQALERVRLATLYNTEGGCTIGFACTPYSDITMDARFITFNCTLRYTMHSPAICMIPLGNWTTIP